MFISARFIMAILLTFNVTAFAESSPATTNESNSMALLAQPVESKTVWQWQTITQGLNHPWGLSFLPDGSFLITERSGNLRTVSAEGAVSAPIQGLPEIDVDGQGGLLDVALASDFASSRRIYFCFSEPGIEGNSTALAEGILSADKQNLAQVKILFSQQPKKDSNLHFGCRIVLSSEHIYLSMGDRYYHRDEVQNLSSHLGKIIRLKLDGSIPADNPFVGVHGARGEIWSYGHRNVQGMTMDNSGRLWLTDHGAQGGDEVNLIHAGKNYGWPIISYGKEYSNAPIGEGVTKQGMEQPLYYWDPSIAPSGMTFVGKNPYGEAWNGNLLVGALKFRYVARLTVNAERIVREEKINVGERVRDVRQGPDGFIYILTDSRNGKLLKLLPN